jgi:hypothetical protein
MRIHIFKGESSWHGFTVLRDGSNLPPDRGPWTFFESVEMDHEDARFQNDFVRAILFAAETGCSVVSEVDVEMKPKDDN